MLTVLTLLAVVFFLFVTGLSRAYYAQRESLGTRWFERGVTDLKAKNYSAAVTEFRTALLYSRDNFSYQLNLAEALIGMHHLGEASAYLLNLWDREPENGLVNLQLAQIAALQGRTEEAIRYYHNAVYAAWPAEEETKRRDARLELIELLLRNREWTQAQSELIALSANASGDATLQKKIGDFFARAGDYEHALEAYRVSLRSDRRNGAALAGAGEAAFEFGRYAVAQKYLQEAIAANPDDKQSAGRLQTAEMVLDMDPFGRQVTPTQRDRLVVDAFATAGQRLTACPETKSDPDGLSAEWTDMKAKVSAAGLRRNPELAETAMDLVFRIERETSVACGMPEGRDLALLLIGKLHEGA
jgi:tetratricopeptide (TPR) repeat protein